MTTRYTNKRNRPLLLTLGKVKLFAALTAAAVVVVSIAVIVRACQDSGLHTETEENIGLTPTQILSMREIGQWEFLSIEDEELVDTVKKGLFSSGSLTRIYYGTLRLGFDMRSVKDGWIRREADTLHVTLPAITLLDENFIDEARTKSFYESGSWSDKDRSELYKQARAKMISRCLTPANIRSAEQNASRQVSQMIKSMGFDYVRIRFEQPDSAAAAERQADK